MKKLLAALISSLLLFSATAVNATVCYPYSGCLGTSTTPQLGQIPIGNKIGTYDLISSSTFANQAYANMTYPSFSYASGTYATQGSLGSYVTYPYASSTYLTIVSASSSFPTFSYASSSFLTIVSASSSFPTFTYASGTYQLAGGYVSTTSPVTGGYVLYASSTKGNALTNSNIFQLNTLIGIGTTTPLGALTVESDNLALTTATPSTSTGLYLINSTPAASSSFQYSPSLYLSSKGWGTTASSSQEAGWIIVSQPFQNTIGSSNLEFWRTQGTSTPVQTFTMSATGATTLTNSLSGITTLGMSSSLTNTQTGLGTTTNTTGFLLTNTTAATAANRTQSPPVFIFSGTAWASSTANSQQNRILIGAMPITGSTTYPTLFIANNQINGGAGLSTATNTLMTISGNETVGIGTTSPIANLSVVGTSSSLSGVSIMPDIFSLSSSSGITLFDISQSGQWTTGTSTQTASTTVSNCGTGATIVGNDTAGTVSVGSGLTTACTITYAVARKNINYGVYVSENGGIAGGASTKNSTSTIITFVGTVASGKFDYLVVGY